MDRLAKIRALLGAGHVLETPAQKSNYLVDERQLYQGQALAVVRPPDREAVAAVVQLADQAELAVVPQGGNTGYCGGATANDGQQQIVLSLERLNRIIEVDKPGATITVEAGVVLAVVQEAAAAAGLLFPLAMGSQGSCQIGGNISTNAGGLAVLRYGTTRELVLGLEAVLPDGQIVSDLGGLRKDNTGYDLKQLFIGAEGTLGVITAACLKLFPQPAHYATALLAINELGDAVDILAALRQAIGDNVTSCEYLSGAAVRMATQAMPALGLPLSPGYDHYLLLEWADYSAGDDAGLVSISNAVETSAVIDAVVAQSTTQRRQLWNLRENIPAAEKLNGGSVKHDISVRLVDVAEYVQRARATMQQHWPQARLSIYGHVGDGNIHFNVLAPEGVDGESFRNQHGQAVSETVHDLAYQMGGSFSAEHGVGVFKRDLLQHYTNPSRLHLMRQIKRAIDPHGRMNPGKLI